MRSHKGRQRGRGETEGEGVCSRGELEQRQFMFLVASCAGWPKLHASSPGTHLLPFREPG